MISLGCWGGGVLFFLDVEVGEIEYTVKSMYLKNPHRLLQNNIYNIYFLFSHIFFSKKNTRCAELQAGECFSNNSTSCKAPAQGGSVFDTYIDGTPCYEMSGSAAAGDFMCSCWKRYNYFALGIAANYFVLDHGYEAAKFGALYDPASPAYHETGRAGSKEVAEVSKLILSVVEGFDEATGTGEILMGFICFFWDGLVFGILVFAGGRETII